MSNKSVDSHYGAGDFEDDGGYDGDLRQHCRTISTAWGQRPARILFFILGALTLLVMMLPYLLDIYQPIYAVIVILGIYPVLLYILTKVTCYRTGPQLERLSQMMKYEPMVLVQRLN